MCLCFFFPFLEEEIGDDVGMMECKVLWHNKTANIVVASWTCP